MAQREGGLLSVVATPIGNLDDVTLRALATLKAADVILAEDTRRTKRLLSHHGVGTRLRSFHAHSKDSEVNAIVSELKDGAHLALVTDAGTPVVSDPGIRLVAAARDAGVDVETIPGPSAVTAAIAVAGIRADAFRFIGFLPRSGGKRRKMLEEIAGERGATILFESPNRVAATLDDLMAVLEDDREAALCRELTKMHEEVLRGSLSTLRRRADEGLKGEVTLIIGGTGQPPGATDELDPAEARAKAAKLLEEGMSRRDAAKWLAAETGLSRKDAYAYVLSLPEPG
jgi:16S rRNA (cytidine1402-2'-O)-methyltransferase